MVTTPAACRMIEILVHEVLSDHGRYLLKVCSPSPLIYSCCKATCDKTFAGLNVRQPGQ